MAKHFQTKNDETEFSDKQAAKVLRTAKKYIAKYNLLRIVTSVITDTCSTVTISHLWRIERYVDKTLRTYEFDLVMGKWREVFIYDNWPHIPLLPFYSTRSLYWKDGLAELIIKTAVLAAASKTQHFEKNDLVLTHLTADYLVGEANRINFYSLKSGAQALRAKLLDLIIDRNVAGFHLTAASRHTLIDNLFLCQHSNSLSRVSKEQRNFLPLLFKINPKYWETTDLFSQANWVESQNATRLVCHEDFIRNGSNWEEKSGRAFMFPTSASYRWLRKAPTTVVKSFAHNPSPRTVSLIVQANINFRLPALGWLALYTTGQSLTNINTADCNKARFLHCAAEFLHNFWKVEGYKTFQHYIKNGNSDYDFADILDWLIEEGFAAGFPHKNSTIKSLAERSDAWHHKGKWDSLPHKIAKWYSLITQFELDGFHVTPLTSTQALFIEGEEMHHCVVTYAKYILLGEYMVFSIKAHSGARSTLGLTFSGEEWRIDQHRGACNQRLPPSFMKIGEHVCHAYQSAYSNDKLARSL